MQGPLLRALTEVSGRHGPRPCGRRRPFCHTTPGTSKELP